MPRFYLDDEEIPKNTWVDYLVMAIVISSLVSFVIWIAWFFGGGYKKTCISTQKITEVQAVGHKYDTSYYIRGDGGGVLNTDELVQVGQTYCFADKTEATQREPFREWIKP
jgi:hypothetical protein